MTNTASQPGFEETKRPSQSDKLLALQIKASEARDLEYMIEELEATAKEKRAEMNVLLQKTLPDMFDEIGIDRIGVPAKGNFSARDYYLRPYYAASIAASWPEERKEEAFKLLERLKASSLIKTVVSAALPKGQLETAKALVAAAKKLKVTADIKLSVHSGTLSAWLRELYERGQSLPQSDLEKIGASVGRVVRAEERPE